MRLKQVDIDTPKGGIYLFDASFNTSIFRILTRTMGELVEVNPSHRGFTKPRCASIASQGMVITLPLISGLDLWFGELNLCFLYRINEKPPLTPPNHQAKPPVKRYLSK